MTNRDRRAQRKAKRRRERIRQDQHQTRFGFTGSGFDFGGSGMGVTGFGDAMPAPMPQMAINVHHVPGGDMVDMERTHRTLNFLMAERPPEGMDDLEQRINAQLTGHAWEENHRRMLLGSAAERAQDLAFAALEQADPIAAVRQAREALAIDGDCCDAHAIVATRGTSDANERLAMLEGAIARERNRLGGDAFFAEHAGHFWGMTDTRPYMRTRYAYALALKDLGRFAEAAGECGALLELCEADRLAVRYQYLACLMAGGLLEELPTAIATHREAHDAPWLWGRVLERLLAGDDDGAVQAIAEARRTNVMVASLLLSPPSERPPCPPRYEIGAATEAAYIADVYGRAWDLHPDALAWLREHG